MSGFKVRIDLVKTTIPSMKYSAIRTILQILPLVVFHHALSIVFFRQGLLILQSKRILNP